MRMRKEELVDTDGVMLHERLHLAFNSVKSMKSDKSLLPRLDKEGIHIDDGLRAKLMGVQPATERPGDHPVLPAVASPPATPPAAVLAPALPPAGPRPQPIPLNVRIATDMRERLRLFVFHYRTSNQAVVADALDAYLKAHGY